MFQANYFRIFEYLPITRCICKTETLSVESETLLVESETLLVESRTLLVELPEILQQKSVIWGAEANLK